MAGRRARWSGFSLGLTGEVVLIAALSVGLFWLVWIYATGLRDPRYLDGWILAGGMALQVGFHIAVKSAALSPKTAMRWRKVHIAAGYVLIAVFVSHSDFSLPDTGFEWALWTAFVLVALSGLFGTYLGWSLKAKRGIEESVTYDRIPALRADLARLAEATVAVTEPALPLLLPGPPHDAWVRDLYANHLHHFFDGERNFAAHLVGSQRPIKRLTDELDNLSRYVDQKNQSRLAILKQLAIEKDRLDFARVYLGLTKGWLYVHVPVTYSLMVLAVLHVVVVYAFSAGDW